jgi:FSR family fosmidomycin resistance protein-like MFS transporter
VATIAGAHAVHDTYTAFLPPLLPELIAKLSLSKTEAGLLSVFLQIPSLLQPFIGHLADRSGLRLVIILTPAVSGAMMSLLGWAPGYAWLAALLTVAGLSSAALHAVAPVIAGRYSGKSLGRGMGFWMVGGELGRTLGPLVIVTGVGLFTLEGSPVLMLGGFVTSALLYITLKDLPSRVRPEAMSRNWRDSLARMRPLFLSLGVLITARSFLIVSLTIYLPTYLTEGGASLWMAGASLSILELAGVAGAIVGGSLSDIVGRRWVLVVAMITAPAFLFLVLDVRGWLLFPVLVAAGFTLLSLGPVIMAIVLESFHENRAFANGVYMAISFLIRSGATVAVGALGDAFGLRWAFTVSAFVMWIGVPLVFLIPRRADRDI